MHVQMDIDPETSEVRSVTVISEPAVPVPDVSLSRKEYFGKLYDELWETVSGIYTRMNELPDGADNPEWQELFMFTRILDSLLGLARIFQNSHQVPF